MDETLDFPKMLTLTTWQKMRELLRSRNFPTVKTDRKRVHVVPRKPQKKGSQKDREKKGREELQEDALISVATVVTTSPSATAP